MLFYLVLTNLVSFAATVFARYAFKPSIGTSVKLRFRGSRLESKLDTKLDPTLDTKDVRA